MQGRQQGRLKDWDFILSTQVSIQESNNSGVEAVLESGDMCFQAFVFSAEMGRRNPIISGMSQIMLAALLRKHEVWVGLWVGGDKGGWWERGLICMVDWAPLLSNLLWS